MDSITIKITSDNGVDAFIPVDLASMSEAERLAFLKFSASGRNKSVLSPEETRLVEAGRVYVKDTEAPEGLICRWDWTCWAV